MYWREKIFYYILTGAMIFGIIVLVPSILSCLKDELYVQIVIDIIIAASVVYLLFEKKIPYPTKSSLFLIILYGLGIPLLLKGNSYATGGFIYLVCISIVASICKSTKAGVISIIQNFVIIFIIAYVSYNNIAIIPSLNSYDILDWTTLGANLLLANGISAVSIGLIIDGLERTINKTTQLKNKLSSERQKLIEARQKAEDADQLKTTFLANMSHDLKTPLNAIIGFSNLTLDTKLKELDTIYKYQQIIAENGTMLLGLINDILDISIIESGALRICKEKTSLKSIIEEVSHTFDDQIIANLKKQVSFTIEDQIQDDDFQFYTDSLRLKQVIHNLINNALKFTNEGEIVFSYVLSTDKNYIQFSVSDTGIGIPEEKIDTIFDRFSKLDETTKNKVKGTGLGLAISKQIVEQMGGRLTVESTYGKGSTFSFTIKL